MAKNKKLFEKISGELCSIIEKIKNYIDISIKMDCFQKVYIRL
jgi:hypothetical protein